MRELPQAEEEDYKIIVQVLAGKLHPVLDDVLDILPAELQPTDAERMRLSRDAAHWVIRASAQDLRESMFKEIADRACMVEARPLPDVMVFPQDITLEASRKNIYGVLPPSTEDAQHVEQVLFMDERAWWIDRAYSMADGTDFIVGRYDGAVKLNNLERSFARALDEAEFVAWWHRNPGDVPMQRLLETKENTKDAARKAQHSPAAYGKVLFLTPDGNRLRWVEDDGRLGDTVDLGDMNGVLLRFAATRPVASS